MVSSAEKRAKAAAKIAGPYIEERMALPEADRPVCDPLISTPLSYPR